MDTPLLIYETLHGSRAYGLAREDSDSDYKGVIIGPPAWYLGFRGGPEQIELGADHVRFELRKFMRLAAAGNPTLLEVLFTDPADHTTCHPLGAALLAERDRFLSRKVATSFGGYALGQLQRIRTHRRWLLAPPKAPPQRADFGLPERPKIPRDQLGAADALETRGAADALPAGALAILDAERRYRRARQEWQQLQTWRRQRNPARAALEARHGYDTKHALHLIRLLRMGLELITTGRLTVRRPDRAELLAIRDGAWPFDALEAQAADLHTTLQAAVATSPLPEAPDEAALDALCVQLITHAHAP